jgi:regulatory protein YycI of two-component signal transduction system YycFG
MRNRKFERAALTRKSIAIFLALLFHLGLLGYIVFNQQATGYFDQLFAEDNQEQLDTSRP